MNLDALCVSRNGDGGLEARFGLAGETNDDVGGNGRTIQRRLDLIDHGQVVFRVVLAVHPAKDIPAARLEREVQMGEHSCDRWRAPRATAHPRRPVRGWTAESVPSLRPRPMPRAAPPVATQRG